MARDMDDIDRTVWTVVFSFENVASVRSEVEVAQQRLALVVVQADFAVTQLGQVARQQLEEQIVGPVGS